MGLLAGFAVGVFVQCLAYLLIVLKQDWQPIADAAISRIEYETTLLDDGNESDCDNFKSYDIQ